jgi:hypothetical protein
LPKSDRGSFSLDRPPFLNLGEKCGLVPLRIVPKSFPPVAVSSPEFAEMRFLVIAEILA